MNKKPQILNTNKTLKFWIWIQAPNKRKRHLQVDQHLAHIAHSRHWSALIMISIDNDQHRGLTAHSRHFHRCLIPPGSHSRKWLCTALGRKHIQLIMHKCIFVGGFFYLLLFWEPAQSPWARRLSPPRPRVLWKARFLTHCRYLRSIVLDFTSLQFHHIFSYFSYLRSIVLVFASGQDSSYVFPIYFWHIVVILGALC